MTGAGAPGAPGIIHCLTQDSNIELFVADANENAVGRYLNGRFHQIPGADDKHFVDSVLKLCSENRIDVVLPLVTSELPHFANHQKAFSSINTKVIVSSSETISIANDKAATYIALKRDGVTVPEFAVAKNLLEFTSAAAQLGWPQQRFCFKPTVSNGSRGFRIVANDANEFDLLFSEKPNQTFISYGDAVRILSSAAFPPLLLSEVLPGEEYSVDCLCYRGEVQLVVPRLREKMVNGISVQGRLVKDDEIINYCQRIVAILNLHGNIGIQVKRRSSGEALLLEINPRVQGTIVTALGAGVNLPLLAIKQQLGLAISEQEMNVNWGTRFSRYWTEVFY